MDPRQRWTLILTAVASLMVGLDLTVVTTALNTIRLDLGASIGELDWTINAYTLTIGVLLLTAAAAGDRLGRRRVLTAGIAMFTASSVACALAPSIGVLIAARAAQGVGTAMVLPQALALLSAAFPPETRGKAMGLFGGITGLAILGGPVIGGAVVQGLAWQWIFWLNVPIGIALIPLVSRHVAEAYGPRAPFDVAGLVLSGAGLLGLVWGLIRGNAAGWGSPQVYGPLAAGTALIAAFAAWERRARSPMLPVSLFRNVPYVAANAAGFTMTAAMMSGAVFFVQYLQASLGEGPLAAGVRLLPLTATLFVVAPVAGRFVTRVGERPIVVTGMLCQAAGMRLDGARHRLVLPGTDPRHDADRHRGVRGAAGRAERRHRGGAPGGDRYRFRRLQRDAPGRRCLRDRDRLGGVHRGRRLRIARRGKPRRPRGAPRNGGDRGGRRDRGHRPPVHPGSRPARRRLHDHSRRGNLRTSGRHLTGLLTPEIMRG